eukprot:2841438-Rhodomonas_salina.1
MATTASNKIFLMGGDLASSPNTYNQLPMPLELLPIGPRSVPFPSTAAGWGPVTEWDYITLSRVATLDYQVDLCTSIFPC